MKNEERWRFLGYRTIDGVNVALLAKSWQEDGAGTAIPHTWEQLHERAAALKEAGEPHDMTSAVIECWHGFHPVSA